jgi:c-di-GMP-binding flagellar brake protein YcgR
VGTIGTRRNRRVFCGAPARIETSKGPARAVARNISCGGAFLACKALPAVGQTVEVEIDLPGRKIKAVAEVRYQYSYPDEGEGVGVRFLRLDGEDVVAIQRFVAERSKD